MEREIECCVCRRDFTVTGYGSYVRCPYCGADLQIGDDVGSWDADDRETEFHERELEDMGYYDEGYDE